VDVKRTRSRSGSQAENHAVLLKEPKQRGDSINYMDELALARKFLFS
jgi:hypothetical protein